MKYFFSFIMLVVTAGSYAQSSCCALSTPAQFARLSKDPAFQASHLSPLPFNYQTDKGQMIHFKTSDGKDGSAFAVKSTIPTENIVIVFHEWWGLNGYIKQEAVKLQQELGNVHVYAVDLYDGKVADNPKDAAAFMADAKEARIRTIIQGIIDYQDRKAKIYTIGWCFGGGWSLQAAIQAGQQAKACVMYYGMPETDPVKLKKLYADVFGIFAELDAWISPALVSGFEKNMLTAWKKLIVKTYKADHAFANPSNPKYNKEFSEDAHKRVLEFFRMHLK